MKIFLILLLQILIFSCSTSQKGINRNPSSYLKNCFWSILDFISTKQVVRHTSRQYQFGIDSSMLKDITLREGIAKAVSRLGASSQVIPEDELKAGNFIFYQVDIYYMRIDNYGDFDDWSNGEVALSVVDSATGKLIGKDLFDEIIIENSDGTQKNLKTKLRITESLRRVDGRALVERIILIRPVNN